MRYPRPEPTPNDQQYWDGLHEGEFRIQRCSDCAATRWYPRPLCSECYSENFKWEPIPLTGNVYTYTVTHQRTGFAFDEFAPFAVAVVELDEGNGVRIAGVLRNVDVNDVRVGMEVTGVIEKVEQERVGEIPLIFFAPARPPEAAGTVSAAEAGA